jgi:UTP--glucose-1-phosphate uridylyltransferase
MKIEKAIISTAGYGTRRLPITKTIDKNMLPIGNRPVIDYVVEECVLAGIKDIYLVVNDAKNGQIKSYYGENILLEAFLKARGATEKLAKLQTAPTGVRLHYVEQDVNDRYGTSVPVTLVAEQFGLNEHVVLCNGDDPFWNAKDGSDVKTLIEGVQSEEESAIMGYEVPKTEVPRYGMLEKNDEGMLVSVVEKPTLDRVTSTLVNLNRVVMSPELIAVMVEYTNDHHFGPKDQEYMLTDGYSEYLKRGGKMRVVPSTGQWLDCGSFEGWLNANNVVYNQ